MKENESKEILSLNEEIEDFMLNSPKKSEPIKIIQDDNLVDTIGEKNMEDEIDTEESRTTRMQKLEERLKQDKKLKIKKIKPEKIKKEKTAKKEKVERSKKEKTPIKASKAQVVFCLVSLIFILSCCVFYGIRLIKYYRVYNPKPESGVNGKLFGTELKNNVSVASKGKGLYRISGNSIFKGEVDNNYVLYSNQLWRIMKINSDGSVDIALDQYINAMKWNKSITKYENSDVNKYLKEVFLPALNKDLLTQTAYCVDEVTSIHDFKCEEYNREEYIRLLSASEFLNSQYESQTFLVEDNMLVWLYNHNAKNVWHINGMNLSESASSFEFLIKPVVRLKNSTQLFSGNGTIEKPYIIEKEEKKLSLGSYVKLDKDIWVVYETDSKSVKLGLSGLIGLTYRFATDSNVFNSSSKHSLAEYLNNKYYNSLSYKDKILDTKWAIGAYTNSYKDVGKKTATAKVGTYNVADLKINNTKDSYYLLTPGDAWYAYMFDQGLRTSKIELSRSIKPTIRINKSKIKSGKGTIDSPYVLEG